MSKFISTEATCQDDSSNNDNAGGTDHYLSDEYTPVGPSRGQRRRIAFYDDSDVEDSEDINPTPESGEKERRLFKKSKKSYPKENDEIIKEMRITNKLLKNLTEKIKETDGRVKKIEENLSSGRSPSVKYSRKKDVPQEVRVSC